MVGVKKVVQRREAKLTHLHAHASAKPSPTHSQVTVVAVDKAILDLMPKSLTVRITLLFNRHESAPSVFTVAANASCLAF